MAITFACPCGKLLKARPEFAGRRTRCTRCHMVLIIPHADQGVGTVSESELLAPMDFGEVDSLIRPGMLPPDPEPPPLESFATTTTAAPAVLVAERVAEPQVPSEPAAEAAPEPPALPRPFPVDTEAPARPVALRRPRPPWLDLFLTIHAWTAIGLGVVQLAVVLAAVALRRAEPTPGLILGSLAGLVAANLLGGLSLLAVAAARVLRERW